MQASQIRNVIGNRVEALTILGADFGLSGGTFRDTGHFTTGASANAELRVTKFGGDGDIGDPQPLGAAPIGWQPRLQGNMGYLQSENHIVSVPFLVGDVSHFDQYAIEFGGGVRFWVSDKLSLAPTFMGIYGHTSNDYVANSAFMQQNLLLATRLGLVNWSVDTWTIRPALNLQYLFTWGRTIITLSSDPTFFHTESFSSSNAHFNVSGDSAFLSNTIDVDIPLGAQLFGHELRSGGYFRSTELYGDLKDGLAVSHLNEFHGRLVLDFLNQLWKVQWIGIGASYVWGNNFSGWTAGADVTFRF